MAESSPLDLVLERLLELLSTEQHLNLSLLSVLSDERLLHLELVLLGKHSGRLLEYLPIVTVLESPLTVVSKTRLKRTGSGQTSLPTKE